MTTMPATSLAACHAIQAEPLLSVKALTSHYGRIQALHGVDLCVGTGQLVALVGANGAGKTTLLRAISGVQPASGGGIDFMQRDIRRMVASRRVRLGISQVPEGRQVFAPMTVEDNLRLGAFTRGKAETAQTLASMYELFPILKDKRGLPAGTLSGGQQQMLAMARALMASPRLLLLDEPSMGLAPLIVREIFELIRTLRDQGITILVVEQNARAALSIADQAYVMELGRIVMSGPGSELLSDDRIRQAYLGM
jgi:branched-chain amino acid transport system ATP-binding protein